LELATLNGKNKKHNQLYGYYDVGIKTMKREGSSFIDTSVLVGF